MRFRVTCIVVAILLDGCASVVPDSIRTTAPGDVQISQVHKQPLQYRDAPVRWGGKVVAVRNERNQTELEIISRDLDSEGRPQKSDFSQGRFLVKVQGFLDPAIYKPSRQVTIRGLIEGFTERTIGEYRYNYPIVAAETVHLWKLPPPPRTYHPYYYDPFYDPWRPWRWPYFRP